MTSPAGSVRPHPRENCCNRPHYSFLGTEMKEGSSGPIVLPEIRFRSHSYIQIILCSTATHSVAIHHSSAHAVHTMQPSTSIHLRRASRYDSDGATGAATVKTMFDISSLCTASVRENSKSGSQQTWTYHRIHVKCFLKRGRTCLIYEHLVQPKTLCSWLKSEI